MPEREKLVEVGVGVSRRFHHGFIDCAKQPEIGLAEALARAPSKEKEARSTTASSPMYIDRMPVAA